ncbi:peptidase [Castellaniella sp. MT123]
MYEINPATGLPMVGGIGGIDVGGSPWGAVNPWSSSYPTDNGFDW